MVRVTFAGFFNLILFSFFSFSADIQILKRYLNLHFVEELLLEGCNLNTFKNWDVENCGNCS